MNLVAEILLLVGATLGVLTWLASRAVRLGSGRPAALIHARRLGTAVAAAQTLLLFGLATPQLDCGSTTLDRALLVVAVALSALCAVWFARRPDGAVASVVWRAYTVTVLVGSVVAAGTTLAVTTCG